jgi:hypothetical protein
MPRSQCGTVAIRARDRAQEPYCRPLAPYIKMPEIRTIKPANTKTFEHTITGLLAKRADLFEEALGLRDRLAEIKNGVTALDRVLGTLGYKGDLEAQISARNGHSAADLDWRGQRVAPACATMRLAIPLSNWAQTALGGHEPGHPFLHIYRRCETRLRSKW